MAISNFNTKIKATQQQYGKDHGFKTDDGSYTRAGKANMVSNVMLVALLTIGILAATGTISLTAAGWSGVGLGSGALLTQWVGGSLGQRKLDLLFQTLLGAGMITVGALGAGGLLTSVQLGLSLSGIIGGQALFYCCCCGAVSARKASNNQLN